MSGYLLFMVLSCLTLFGCEDPGLVGSGFTDTGTDIKVDTIQISNMGSHSFSHFSGRLSHISSGRFNDPVFGDLEAIGLIKPGLSAADDDTMQADANMKLRFIINQDEIYGDGEAAADFDLVELDQIWRGKAWKINDVVQLSPNPPVASFSVGDQDTIDISLSSQWVEKYRDFFVDESANRDSLYRIEFPGLAVVPRNTAKIVPFNADSSLFIIENPDEDTLQLSPNDWAYSLNRTNSQQAPAGTFKMHSTYENIINFDMQLNRDALGTVNISRVELVFYENAELLANSLPPGASRPGFSSAGLFIAEPEDVPLALDAGSAVVQGQYNEDDSSIRFNLTTFTNSILLDELPAELKFYLTIQSNNGLIHSSLLYNNQAPISQKPKLIITSVQNETGENSN